MNVAKRQKSLPFQGRGNPLLPEGEGGTPLKGRGPRPVRRPLRAQRGYKSAGQKSAEAVLDDLLSACTPKKPLEGPLALEFIAGMPIPASTPKKQREAMLRGEIAHTKKPDLDNMAKQLKDAMSRAGFWGDDRQVVSLRCSKCYAAVPHWGGGCVPPLGGGA